MIQTNKLWDDSQLYKLWFEAKKHWNVRITIQASVLNIFYEGFRYNPTKHSWICVQPHLYIPVHLNILIYLFLSKITEFYCVLFAQSLFFILMIFFFCLFTCLNCHNLWSTPDLRFTVGYTYMWLHITVYVTNKNLEFWIKMAV